MPPSDEEVRTALEMIPINVLRTMIEERDIGVKSRSSDELIDHLVDDGWSGEEYEDLKQRLVDIERERQPYSRYIVDMDSINQGVDPDEPTDERIEHILRTNSSDFDEFGLSEPGFQIETVDENAVTGIHWTKSTNYKISPLNEVKTDETVYDTGFNFDLDDNIIQINCSLPAKAKSFVKVLNNNGITTGDVGHDDLSNERANQYVQNFIDEFKDKLLDRTDQASLDPTDTPAVLEIDLVEMLVDEEELEDIRIGGRTNIISNSAVEEFLEEHDARVVRLEGQFRLDNTYYNFTTGYTDGMGQVSVKKQGRVEERPHLVEEAFDFIYEHYNRHFVNV